MIMILTMNSIVSYRNVSDHYQQQSKDLTITQTTWWDYIDQLIQGKTHLNKLITKVNYYNFHNV